MNDVGEVNPMELILEAQRAQKLLKAATQVLARKGTARVYTQRASSIHHETHRAYTTCLRKQLKALARHIGRAHWQKYAPA